MSSMQVITLQPQSLAVRTQEKYANMPALSRTAMRIPRSEMPAEITKQHRIYRTFPALTNDGKRTAIQIYRRKVKAPSASNPARMVWVWSAYEYDGHGGCERICHDDVKTDLVNGLTDIYAQYVRLDDRDAIGASAWEVASQFVKAVLR